MVFRMALKDNKSFSKIIIESLQSRYKRSDLYDPEYPMVMDFLRETRPLINRKFTTDFRKSISGETPLNFLLKFTNPGAVGLRNRYIENILQNQPQFAVILPRIIEKQAEIKKRLNKRYVNQSNKYITNQERLARLKAGPAENSLRIKKDRTRLKNITKSIVDNRYSTGVFVSKHSGDVHRINEGIHYLDTHEYGHFGFKFVYDDALQNVMENYSSQQIEFGKKRAEEQYANLSDGDKAIIGQTQEQHRADVIAAQQIADPNLSQRDNAILGGASGAAAASTPVAGYDVPPQNVQPKANTTPVQNMYSMDNK